MWIKDLVSFIKLRKELKQIYKDENLVERFTELYGVNFKVDRAARLYAVINPLLLNLKQNNTSQIYEYTSEGMTDYTYIKQYILTKLMAVEQMFVAQNLLDVLLFNIRAVDIDGKPSGNYLITFTPYNFKAYDKAKKKLFILIGTIILLCIIGLIALKIFM